VSRTKGQESGDVRRIWEETGWDKRVEKEGLNGLGGMRAEEVMMGKVRRIRERTEGIQECGRSGGDSGVPDEKWIQGEVSHGVKGERVSWKESWPAGVSGGEAGRRDVAATGSPQKGSMGTGALGAKV